MDADMTMRTDVAEEQVSGGQGNKQPPVAPDPPDMNVDSSLSGGGNGSGAAVASTAELIDGITEDLNDTSNLSIIDVNIAPYYYYNKVSASTDLVTIQIFALGKSEFSIFATYEKLDQLRQSDVLAVHFEGFTIGGVTLGELQLEDWAALFDCNEYEDMNGRVENRRYACHGSHYRNSLTIVRTSSTKKRKTGNPRFGFLDRTRLRLLASKRFLATKTLLIQRTDHGGTRTPAYAREIGAYRFPIGNDTSHQAYSS